MLGHMKIVIATARSASRNAPDAYCDLRFRARI
jgi:hypothetical protein